MFYQYLFKVLPSTLNAYFSDIYRWLKYSIKDNYRVNQNHAKARLLLHLHGLEKGLSFKVVKAGFGKEKAADLLLRTDKYMQRYGIDEVALLSLGVVNAFLKHPNSGVTENLLTSFDSIVRNYSINLNELEGGVKPIHKHIDLDFRTTYDELLKVATSRTSVRNYSTIEITSDEIERAVKYAQTTPSVCNRQTSRVHVFSKDINRILETQLGNQGWADKANKLFVITTDLNYFGSVYERNQAFIDGGMFAMQFVMGLHSQKIASCCKMYIRRPDLDKRFYKATSISPNEVPIMLILAGHYDSEAVNVPYSYRYSELETVMRIHY